MAAKSSPRIGGYEVIILKSQLITLFIYKNKNTTDKLLISKLKLVM
jgi:hypothetical protein